MTENTLPRSSPVASGNGHKRRVLVLDDEIAIQRLLRVILEDEGYEVLNTDDGRIAMEMIDRQPVDLIIQDLRMPKMDGLTFLKLLKERHPDIPSIVVTAFGTFETAIEAMRLGAYTHLTKPFDTEDMRQTVSRALDRIDIRRRSPRSGASAIDMISNTPLMAQVSSLINRVGPADSTILITGESGTGKELVAHAIHHASLRADQQFVAVNCGAFAETLLESELFGHIKGAFTNAIADRKGVFESADGGTLFMDEVGELTLPTQVKLLRVLETRTFKPVGGSRDMKVDVRFIAATNRNLFQMVAEGKFREDLYYRLNVIPIELPPLRERKEDIPLLAGHFLARFAKRMNKHVSAIDDSVIEKLLAYTWPGNIRELENTIERAVALCSRERVTLNDLAGPVLGNQSGRYSGTTPAANKPMLTSGRQPIPGTPSGASTLAPAEVRDLRTSYTHAPAAALPVENAEESVSALTQIDTKALPPDGMDLEMYLLELERSYIIQALDRCNWNLTDAAKLLKMTFRSIRYRVAKLGIERPPKDL